MVDKQNNVTVSKSSDKVRAWERDRRERLNICFKNLASLLPNYDPSAKLSKHEILERAAAYIRDLQENYRALLQFRLDETECSEVRLLKDHVSELVKRVQQLVKLLQDASIPVPPYLPLDSTLTSLSHTHRWSSKLRPEDTLLLYERVQKLKAEKAEQSKKARTEVKKKVHKLNKVQVVKTVNTTAAVVNTSKVTTKKSVSSTSAVPSNLLKKAKMCRKSKTVKSSKVTQKVFGDKLPTVAQLLGLSITEVETSPTGSIVSTLAAQESPAATSALISTSTAQIPSGFIVIQSSNGIQQSSIANPPRTLQQQCFVTKNAAAATSNGIHPMSLVVSNGKKTAAKKKKQNSIVVTKSHLLTAPVIAGGIQTCAPTAMIANPAGLGPGTLILANGNIVPVLPPPPTVLATPAQIIVNSNPLPTPAPTNATPVIMMQQQKNTFTLVTTTTNTSTMPSTVVTSKSQQRGFPLLMPRKKQDNTKTTFANKVPIPALSAKHQPENQASAQNTSAIQVSVKTNKTRNKMESENTKYASNTISTEKTKNTSQTSKRSKALKVKETVKEKNSKSSASLEETEDMDTGKSSPHPNGSEPENAVVSLELITMDNEAHDGLEEPIKSCQKDGNLSLNVNEAVTTQHNVEETYDKSSHSKQNASDITKGHKNTSTNEYCNSTRKRKSENVDEEDPISQKKHKCHTQDQKLLDSLADSSCDASSPQVHEHEVQQTVSTAVTVFKSCNSGSYTIDSLCNSKEDTSKNTEEIRMADVTTSSCATSTSFFQQTSQQLNLDSKGCSSTVMDVAEDRPAEKQADSTDSFEQAEKRETFALTDSSNRDNDSSILKSDNVHKTLSKNPPCLTDSTTLPNDTSQNSSTSNTEARASDKNQCSSEVVHTSDSPNYATTTHNEEPSCVSLSNNSAQDSETLLDQTTSSPYSSTSSDIKSEMHRSLQIPQCSNEEKGKVNAETPEKDTKMPPIITTDTISSEILPADKELGENTVSDQVDIEKLEQNDQQSSHSQQIAPPILPELGISSIQHTTSTTTVSTSHRSDHSFVPISNIPEMDASPRTSDSETNLNTSLNISLSNPEFSNDLFASLQVPSGSQHPESISPTAAFLLAFPLVSSSKVTEMIVDSQEETGCDSIQETATLLQIGNIEQETSVKEPDLQTENGRVKEGEIYTSKMQSKSDTSPSGNVTTLAEEQISCATTSNSHINTIKRGELQITNMQAEKSEHSSEGHKIQEKSSTETSLSPNALKQREKQCSSNETTETQDLEESTLIPKSQNRSVGTQLSLFDSIHLKASETTSVQVSLSSDHLETSMYDLPMQPNNSKENVTSNRNYMQEAVTCSSAMPDIPVSVCATQSKASSGYHHQQSQLSSTLFHPLKTFETSTQKPTSNTDLSEMLSIASSNTNNKYAIQLQNAMDDAVMKLTRAVNSQVHTTVASASGAYSFTSNRGPKPTHSSTTTSTNETVNENSFAKTPSEGKLQEDKTQANTTESVYKPIGNTDFQKENFSSHTATSSSLGNQERTDSFNDQSPTQSYSYTFDYSLMTTQNDTDQNKLMKPSSFSVAHSSSNFGILSWTTLSPVSTIANVSHCEHLRSTPAQNVPITTDHNTMTSTSSSLGHKQPDANRALNNDRISTTATSLARMHKTIQNTCHKQSKNNNNPEHNANSAIQKINFTNQYTAEGQQMHRDIEDSHTHCHQVKDQMLGTQDEGRSSDNFKFLHSMPSEGKECQSSSNRGKQSQQNSQHHRPPVNWMTAPDIRSGSMPCPNITTVPSSTVGCLTSSSSIPATAITVASSSHANKDFDFGNTRSNYNLFLNTTSASSSNFDSRMLSSNHNFYGSSMLSSHNNFYATSRQPSHTIPKEDNSSNARNTHTNSTHRLPELPAQGQNHHNEAYSLPWEPKKVPYSSSSTIFSDLNASNFVPTTLPTLVGDLALGTPYSVSGGTGDDHGHTKPFGHTDFSDGDVNKKGVLDIHRHDVALKQYPSSRHPEKQQTSDKGNNGNRICAQEYRGATETSGGGTSGNFLSVSQLVDHVKSSRSQVAVGQRKGTSSRQTLGGSNKQSLNNSRQQHVAVSESSATTNKRTEKDSNKKSQQQINTNNITYNAATVVASSAENKSSSVPSSRSNNLYPSEPSTTITTAISQNNTVFPMSIHGIGTHPVAPVSSSVHSWSTNRVKSSGASVSAGTFKAPVSSYSAEALIGSSSAVQSENSSSHLPHEGPNSKMITLPPPMVSERFRHSQNYHHHHPPALSQSSRSLQVAVSFSNDTIISGNYYPSVELQNSHQNSNNSLLQGNSHHENFSQNQHTYNNASFPYSQTGANNMGSQNSTGLYPGGNFAPDPIANTRNTSTAVSSGFLPGSSSFPGAVVPSDITSTIGFPPPPPIMKSITSNCSSSSQQNLTYINATTSASSQHHHHNGQQISSHNDSGNRSNAMATAASTNQNNRRNQTTHQSSNVNSGSSCSAAKQRASRRRVPESITSVSGNSSTGLASLVDLGYLPMPPGIGSPLLGADDGTFLSHHAGGTFLAPPPPPGPQLYPAGPPPPVSQAPLYPPPPPARSQSQQNVHHSGSHLAAFSCSSAMQNRTSHHQQQLHHHHHHHHHQQQSNASPSAGSSSGNSLANFNLSTIFPEINDKQVSSVSSVAAFSGAVSSKTLPAVPPPPPPPPPPPSSSSLLSNNAHQHNPLLASSGNETDFSRRLAPPPTPVPSNCLPPVPLPTNFNNILSHAPPPPQVGRMQWP